MFHSNTPAFVLTCGIQNRFKKVQADVGRWAVRVAWILVGGGKGCGLWAETCPGVSPPSLMEAPWVLGGSWCIWHSLPGKSSGRLGAGASA